jgi:hypothetical protein
MSNQVVLRHTCHFFASDEWWKPVITFLFSRCSYFWSLTPTHDEYSCFSEFQALVADLVDNQLCGKIGISPVAFENAMFSLFESRDVPAAVVLETLTKATDFLEFRAQMIQNNLRLEETVSHAIADFTQQHPDVTDPDEIAQAVAAVVQQQEDDEISELVTKSCSQMYCLLEIDLLDEKARKRSPRRQQVAQVDPVEVERRHQFYVQQRDILRQKEEREGRIRRPPESPIKVFVKGKRLHSPQ